jgi:hypothetical protein
MDSGKKCDPPNGNGGLQLTAALTYGRKLLLNKWLDMLSSPDKSGSSRILAGLPDHLLDPSPGTES